MRNTTILTILLLTIIYMPACKCDKPPQWQALGPYTVSGMQSFADVAGKVDDIQFSTDYDGQGHRAMFIACGATYRGDFGGGGIWRSTDFMSAAPTWIPLTDHVPGVVEDRRMYVNNIITIAIDPKHQQSIWAAAGGFPPALLHSSDGGNNWTVEGLNQLSSDGSVYKVLVDPDGRIWVATTTGLYISEDRGVHFIRFDDSQFPGKSFSFYDLTWYSPTNGAFNIYSVYVGVIDPSKSLADNQTGIYSITGNSGHYIWTRMAINLKNIYGDEIKDTLVATIRFGALQGAGVVASIGKLGDMDCNDPTHSIWGLLNVYQLGDNTWQPKWQRSREYAGDEIQNGYCQPICLMPGGLIVGGGKGISVSDGKGGESSLGGDAQKFSDCKLEDFKPITDPAGKTFHTDPHVVSYCNADGKLYMGNDGGLVRFTLNPQVPGGVNSWETLNTPSLCNFLSESVAFHFNSPYNVLAGHQDNGVVHLSNTKWSFVGGNETDFVYFDPFGTGYIWDISQDPGSLSVSTDGGKTFPGRVSFPARPTGPLLTFHPAQAGRMLIACNKDGALPEEAAVYETTDGFASADHTRKLPVTNTSDHFYTIYPGKDKPAQYGYDFEGVEGYVYDAQQRGTVPLSRWYSPITGDHFYTLHPETEQPGLHGYIDEKTACYVLATMQTGSLPLTRWYNPVSGDHFYTLHPETEKPGEKGYTSEGNEGFVFTTPQTGTDPFTRWYNHFKGSPTALCYVGNTIYVCVDGKVFQGPDDGSYWRVIYTAPSMIVSVCPDINNPGALYIATDAKIFVNNDVHAAPGNFTDITGNLPVAPTKMVLYSKGAGKPPILYVSSITHIYRTTSLSGNRTNWGEFDNALPDTHIMDLQVNPFSHWLYVATFGRGVWNTIDLDQIR